MRFRFPAAAGLLAAAAIPVVAATPVAAGVPPMSAYAVVRDASDTDGYIVGGTNVFNSLIGRVSARKTEVGSVEVRFSTWTFNGINPLVTPLTSKPRSCVVGSIIPQATYTSVSVDCYSRLGVPTDTPFVLSVRGLRAGHGHVAYLHANNPGLPGYIPEDVSQMNGTAPGPINNIVKLDTGLWQARLADLGAAGGTVQVSSRGQIGPRCGAVSWVPDGDDELVTVRCRTLAGEPLDTRFSLWYAKGQSLGSELPRKQAYLFAHRPKAASYTPKQRFSTEGGTPHVTRQAKGRWTVTLPGMPKGGAAHVTPIGDGGVRCNISSIRRYALPQRIGVRCWNPSGQPANAKFTLAYLR